MTRALTQSRRLVHFANDTRGLSAVKVPVAVRPKVLEEFVVAVVPPDRERA